MVTAAILINQSGKPTALSGRSRDDLDLGVLVTLSNNNDAGVVSWLWEFVSKPPGSTASLGTPTSATSFFTPDIRGSYFIKLTATDGASSTETDERIAAVKTSYFGIRIPAVEEKGEFHPSFPDVSESGQGWAQALHSALIIMDTNAVTNLKNDGSNSPTQNISWNSKKIINLSDPGNSQDAATKNYVDTHATAHAIGSSTHTASTLAQLNIKISDATLDDSSASRPPNGTASGDLADTYPSPRVAKIQGRNISTAVPTDGYALIWNNSSSYWGPTEIALTMDQVYDGSLGAGSGRTITIDSGPIELNANEGFAIDIDGYIGFLELSSDPSLITNYGIVYSKEVDGYTELFYMDNYGIVDQITSQGSLNTDPITLDQAYDGTGSGAGRSIVADSGPIEVNAGGDFALKLDGYISLSEIVDPSAISNIGSLYVKDIDGYSELHYIDNYGSITQITVDGYLSVVLKSTGGFCFRLSVDDSGNLITTEL